MADAWRNYRGAPAEGTPLCPLGAIPDPGTHSVMAGRFPVLLARNGATLRAYVNACPHQYLPLDHRGPNVISADGTVLRCTNHDAAFRLEDGVGIEGLGFGCALDAIPVAVDAAGMVVIGGTP